MIKVNDLISKLPDSLNGHFGKNIRKLCQFLASSFTEMEDLFNQIQAYRSIDKAEGVALDRLGEKYGKKRGTADDAFYRIMIKAVVASHKGDATVNGILRAIRDTLDVPIKGVKIQDLRQYFNTGQEPLAIKITNIQFSNLDDAKKIRIIQEQIKSIVAAGVRVASIEFTDTANGELHVVTFVQAEEIYELEEA